MAAIPQAIAASDAVPRESWVPVNKAIQAYQAGTSDPKLAAFAVANLQIGELWARAMNPTSTANHSVANRVSIIAAVLVAGVTCPNVCSCSFSALSVTPSPPGTGTRAPTSVLVA